MKAFIIIILTVTSCKLSAAKYALVIGGSGEDFKKENFFLSDFDRLNKALVKRGFEVVNIFDNEKTKGKFQAKSATNDNILVAIDELRNKIKQGDEVAIVIHSHGGEPGLRVGSVGHPILTESGGLEVSKLLPFLRSTKARKLLVDLSCYSGKTQELIEYKKRTDLGHYYDFDGKPKRGYLPPLKPSDAEKGLCIVSAASPRYVSICSGDKSSNSFTAALIEGLEQRGHISSEDLFNQSRKKDQSFTNMPQISSYTKALENPWNAFLADTDPVGESSNEDITEAEFCASCMESKIKLIDKTTKKLANKLGSEKSKSILDQYRRAVKLQIGLNVEFERLVGKAWKRLTSLEKYKRYKNTPPSKVLFFADLENIPGLSVEKDKDGIKFSKSNEYFLNSFNYLSHDLKLEMMLAMNHKELIGHLVADLNSEITSIKKVRDENRELIQNLARTLLKHERDEYAKTFKSKRGNICQKFQL